MIDERGHMLFLMNDAEDDSCAICRFQALVKDDVFSAIDGAHAFYEQAPVFASLWIFGDALEGEHHRTIVNEPLIAPPCLNRVGTDVLKVSTGKLREFKRYLPD